MPRADYSFIRPEIREAIDAYAEMGRPVGGFLTAALENNLREAFGMADEGNIEAMFHIVCYFHNEIPGLCWGSPERVKAWLLKKEQERSAAVVPNHGRA
jgi:hypothetical protein